MQAIGTPQGLILRFESKEELKKHIENLKTQLDFIERKDVPAPHLYALYDDRIPDSEMIKILNKIKPKAKVEPL
jgi:hypothetical protein